MSIRTKKIVCYNCEKAKGVASWRSSIQFEKATSKQKKVWGWKAKGFKHIDGLWLCNKCDKTRRCEKCGILLSNLWKCKCGEMHTAYYEKYPNYCKKCLDEIKKGR